MSDKKKETVAEVPATATANQNGQSHANGTALPNQGNSFTPPKRKKLEFDAPIPHANPVCIASLLDEIVDIIKQHTILSQEEGDVVATWAVFSYCLDCFKHSPRLLISSPEMQCGKTTLLEIIGELAFKAFHLSNLTPAALYRIVDLHRPTIIADEADTYVHDNEAMRNILNQGHSKAGSHVIRCKANTHEVESFDAYCALVLGQIGLPPLTVLDRCIPVYMKRKKATEHVLPFQNNNPVTVQRMAEIRSRIMRWVNDNRHALSLTIPAMPPMVQNRNADKWRPLFSIAQMAGAQWPIRMENAASRVISNSQGDESLAIQLLADIRVIIQRVGTNHPQMMTSDILIGLNDPDDRPWKTIHYGKPLDARRLSDLLRPFGIRPRNLTFPEGRKKGYTVLDFDDAFERYLSP